MSEERYIPAARRRSLTPRFDPVMAVTTRKRHWRGQVVDEALATSPATISGTLELLAGRPTMPPRKDEMPTPATACSS